MSFDFLLSFGAGALTTLSPCILPLLPIMVGGVMQKNRFAPALMAVGMTGTFVVAGLLLSQTGTLMGLERETVTLVASVIFVLIGLVLLVPWLQKKFTSMMQPVAQFSSAVGTKAENWGALGYILTGALLGLIWAPCSGPTLGVAFTLAAKDDSIIRATSLLTLFGVGASIPLLGVAYGAKNILASNRMKLLKGGKTGKYVLGTVMILLGVLTGFGFDKSLETALLSNLPDWWVNLSTLL